MAIISLFLLLSTNSNSQTYCASYYLGGYFTDYINEVNFNGITNTSQGTPYSDFTTLTSDVARGLSYELKVNVANFQLATQYVRVWFDWNQDNDFTDPGESLAVGTNTIVYGILTVMVDVPSDAELGPTRMRLSLSRGYDPLPCFIPSNPAFFVGETEDYTVNVNLEPKRWTGLVNGQWNETGNWEDNTLPTITDDVLIPSGTPFYPNFNGSIYVGAAFGSNVCQSLEVASGASFTLTGWGEISIYQKKVTVNPGAVVNVKRIKVDYAGRLFINGGTVTASDYCHFNFASGGNMSNGTLNVGVQLRFEQNTNWKATGGTINLLGGGVSTNVRVLSPVTLNNVVIQNGGTAIIKNTSTQSLFLNGNLTLEPNARLTREASGNTLIVVGNLAIKGDATGKASWLDQGTGPLFVLGSKTVESYYTDNRWHFISSPVSNAVSNVFFDIYLRDFDESTNSYGPYVVPTTLPLNVGKGWEIWSTLGNPTVSYLGGEINYGDYPIAVQATDQPPFNGVVDGGQEGYNLVGNPYPSAIDLGTENDPVAGYTWTQLDMTVYAWNGTAWSSFNMAGDGAGVNGGTRYVPSMQAFFVHANDFSPQLVIPNSARLHSAQANYKSGANPGQQIKLQVVGNGYSDEIMVREIENSTYAVDSKYDGHKLAGITEVPELSSISNGEKLSINSIPDFKDDLIVPVHLSVGNNGLYSISTSELKLADEGLIIYLEDRKNDVFVRMEGNTLYDFSANVNDDNHRFNLLFKSSGDDNQPVISDVNIFSHGNTVYVKNPNGSVCDVFVYDIMGRKVSSLTGNADESIELNVAGTGNYVVKVMNGNRVSTQKVFID